MAINMAISTKYGPFMALFPPKYGSYQETGFHRGGGGGALGFPPPNESFPPQEILQQQLNNIEENYTTIQCFCSLNISKTSLKFNLR